MKKLTIQIAMALLCRFFSRPSPRFYLLFGFLLILLSEPSFAQSSHHNFITGTVLSSDLHQPLQGATVSIKNRSVSVITDASGNFSIATLDTAGILKVSFIGYETAEIKFSVAVINKVTVSLNLNQSQLKEVVVSTGYQTLSKERVNGSFAQVNNELLNRRTSPDILSRLEGVVPGLLFNRNTINGSGGNVDISIRGQNTLFANSQPLIVLDGFPYDGDVNNINPNDIESITVLKDASAASIWGVRSGNGVIVMTSKKAKRNQPLSIELNANITVGNKPNLFYSPNFLDAKDFISIEQTLFKQGYYDSDLSSGYLPLTPAVQLMSDQRAGLITLSQLADQLNLLGQNDIRKDETKYLFRQSANQQYNVNLKGGGDKSDYYISLGQDQDNSYYKGDGNGRYTINTRLNFYPLKNLQLTVGENYIRSSSTANNPLIEYGNLSIGANAIYPYATLTNPDGTPAPLPKDFSQNYVNSAGNGKLLDWNYRPLDELRSANSTTTNIENRFNFGAQYGFFKDWHFDLKYQYEHYNTLQKNDYNSSSYYARNLINEFTVINPDGSVDNNIPVGGILQQNENTFTSQDARAQLDFNHEWNSKHSLSAIIGSEVSSTVTNNSAFTAYGYDNSTGSSEGTIDYATSFNQLPRGAGKIPNTFGFGGTTDNFISYYTNAGYSYLNRYSFSASARIDKSNLFGVNTNQKAVPLYSLGAGWELSKEDFYHFDWLSYLKLKVTYGYTGNINKTATAVTTLTQESGDYYSGDSYNVIASPGNPELRWERDRMTNIGVDFASKNQVISGSLEYYRKNGIDLFGNSLLAPSTGYATFFGNTADTKGHGIDIVVNTKNINTTNFKWTTNFLFSHVIDIVTKYDVSTTSSNYIIQSSASNILPLPGKSIFGLYSYAWAGLTHDTGDPQGFLNGKVSTDYASIISNTSVNNMVYNGSSRPTTFGSLRNTFMYKSLSLSVNVIYKLNYYFRKSSSNSANLPYSLTADYNARWQKPGDEAKTNVPSLQYPPLTTDRDLFYTYSSALIDNGSHVRLQDLKLAYDFDKLKKSPFKRLEVYSYVNNIAILWRANKDHLDPDLSTNTVNTFPIPRTFSLGLNATF